MMYDGQKCSPSSSSIAWFHQLHLISKYFRMKNESECFSGSLCITKCGPLFLKIIFLSSNDIKELWVKGFCSQLEGNIVEGFNFFAFLPTMGRFATYSRSVKIYVEVWPTRRARNYSFFLRARLWTASWYENSNWKKSLCDSHKRLSRARKYIEIY